LLVAKSEAILYNIKNYDLKHNRWMGSAAWQIRRNLEKILRKSTKKKVVKLSIS